MRQSSAQRQYKETCEERSRVAGTEKGLYSDSFLRQHGLHVYPIGHTGLEVEVLTPSQLEDISAIEKGETLISDRK